MIILRNKQFSPTTKAAREELADYIIGDKTIDFSKLSVEDSEKLRKMLASLQGSIYDFTTRRSKPYIPENVEEIFDKLGMKKTSEGIREMIHKATDPKILQKLSIQNKKRIGKIGWKIYRQSDLNNFSKKLNEEAVEKAHRFKDHNTPHKQDGGDIESWYNKNIAIQKPIDPKNPEKYTVQKPTIIKEYKSKENRHMARFDSLSTGSLIGGHQRVSKGISMTKTARKQLGTFMHEAGHEQNTEEGQVENLSNLEKLGEEIVASTKADKFMREMGKSKKEIRQGNKMNGVSLKTYLPDIFSSPIANYLYAGASNRYDKKDDELSHIRATKKKGLI